MTQPTSPPEYFTVKQTAEYLQVSERTIWRFIANGLLNIQRIGPKTVRITREAIEKLMERNSNQ